MSPLCLLLTHFTFVFAAAGAVGAHEEEQDVALSSGPYSVEPGDIAAAFSVPTLDGRFVYEPGAFRGSLVIHAFTNRSAFLESLWSSAEALAPLVHELPQSAHVLFLSLDDAALSDALWMRAQLQRVATDRGFVSKRGTLSRLHFCPVPVFALGNWIPAVLNSWGCTTHNCGLSQAVFTSSEWKIPIIVKRLDARYDWLRKRWGQRSYRLVDAGDGCAPSAGVEGAVAWVSEDGCSFFTKVESMAKSNASGVLVFAGPDKPIRDMTCEGPRSDCDSLSHNVTAAMVHLEPSVMQALGLGRSVNVSFQATPSPKFFLCIDQQGALAEMGGFLFPTFRFITWQAQWFDFHSRLVSELQSPASVLSVFDKVQMQGERGAKATVNLPPGVLDSDRLELDMSLSCPSSRDVSCAHWDRTVRLFVCCDRLSVNCNVELGRWITAFRRGIGRWLTDVSPLLPLLDSATCAFTVKTDPWAMPWIVSLKLRFSLTSGTGPAGGAPLRPFRVMSLFSGGTFDREYNNNFRPFKFTAPVSTTKVELYAVITGHGSDENECGEFCVTSHHFTVNSAYNNSLTFNTANSPLGCTLKVPEGAVPNEYGTWLYGRGGWCCGLQVDPWRLDLTHQVDLSGSSNSVLYSGLFEDRHPNPSAQPGYFIMSSFLVFYK